MPRRMMVAGLGLVLVLTGSIVSADTGRMEGPAGSSHRTITGTVTDDRSGLLSVKTSDGVTMTLSPNASRRHGHAAPKVGDEVTLVLNENNTVIDVHPKGQVGAHQFVTGNLVYVGRMKPEIKLRTSEGDKIFPLERLDIKTGTFEEGSLVTAELNEAGSVIDLHRAHE